MSDVTDTYYPGEAFLGYGAQIEVGQDDGSPESFVAVADVFSITPGEMSTAVVEKTHLRSPGGHREKLLALRDSGPFVLKGNWRPKHGTQSNNTNTTADGVASGRGLIALWRNRTEANFQIVLNDGSPATVWPFRGGVTKFQPGDISGDAKVDFTCEITPLGDSTADLP
jgi:Lambda phage tail tube protein, TTP